MKSIKIISIPPGFAPEHIRTQWVGVTLPLLKDEQLTEILTPPVAMQYKGEYFVSYDEAVSALRKENRIEAAEFYQSQSFNRRLLWFRSDVCQITK